MVNYENGVCYRTLDFLGYPNYRVGFDGSIWSNYKNKWKRLKCSVVQGGARTENQYIRTTLYDKNHVPKRYKVHIIVLLAFIGERPIGMYSCHKDDNGLNNHIDNLRWDTSKNNHIDMRKNTDWNKNTTKGEKQGSSKLKNEDIFIIRNGNYSIKELSEKFKVSIGTIQHVLKRRTWKHI